MKLKPINQILTIGLIPLSILVGGAAMAASSPPPTESSVATNTQSKAKEKGTSSTSAPTAQAPSEDADEGGQEGKDAFEQASGMERDQPTGADRSPDMKQQQPYDSQIEHKVENGSPPAPTSAN